MGAANRQSKIAAQKFVLCSPCSAMLQPSRIIPAEVHFMQTAYILTGTLNDDQTVTLDEVLPLKPMKVRVSIEPLTPVHPRPHDEVIAEIWARQNARGHVPRTREEIDAELQAERESWDD
jgi:hypothetical protein